MYSVSGLITRIRTIIDEPDEDNSNVTDAELVYFLNMAQLDIASEISWAPYSNVALTGDDFDANKEYEIGRDLLSVERVHVNQVEFPVIPYEPYDNSRYTPKGFYVRDNMLGIPAIQDGDEVKLWGRTTLDELTSASTPALPAVYSLPLIAYGVKMCKAKEQDEAGVSFWDQIYRRDLTNAKRASAHVQVGVRQIRKVV